MRQEVLTLPENLGSSPVFGGIHVVHLFSFLCCVLSSVCLRPVSFFSTKCCQCLWIVHS